MTSDVKPRSTYYLVSETGPDWQPQGVPSMYTQIVPITFDQGYNSLTHNVDIQPSSGYFDKTQAYNTDEIKTCGYRFVKRPCDRSIPHKK